MVPSISGTSRACSWPYVTGQLAKASDRQKLAQLVEYAYIVQDKEYFRLCLSTISIAQVSEGLGTTCRREVAVSVRTPPNAPRWTGRAVLADRREEAGREKREIERANTMMNTKNPMYEC